MYNTDSAEHPGLILKERFLDPLGIAPSELAKSIDVSKRRVSELLRGRRRLSPEMAHRLALHFNVPARWFLEMQARYDACSPPAGLAIRPRERTEGFIITPGGALPLQKSSRAPLPATVHVSDELLARLKAQVALSGRKMNRRPKIITLPDGTPVLTGD